MTPETEVTLKACPICDGKAAIEDIGLPDTRIWCTVCQLATKWHDTRAEAIAAWNRRTHEQD